MEFCISSGRTYAVLVFLSTESAKRSPSKNVDPLFRKTYDVASGLQGLFASSLLLVTACHFDWMCGVCLRCCKERKGERDA
jgi:hypothetical protein